MFIDPADLQHNHQRLEEIEKASMRLVVQALYEFRETAALIFAREPDLAQDVAEDITREALDRIGVSRIDLRLFGKIDYKRARYVFHPEYAVRQALFVDSKAEKEVATATLQTAQTSMRIRHLRANQEVDVPGELPIVVQNDMGAFIATSIFVKFHYEDNPVTRLLGITVACVPNGFLQNYYNPCAQDTIWRAGRNAPSRGEPFRVRLVFGLLKTKMCWRVQNVPIPPPPATDSLPIHQDNFPWDE